MKKVFALALAAVVFLNCCSSPPRTVNELQAFVKDEDNGLRKAREVNDFRMEVTYRPTDLIVAHALSAKKTSDTSEVRKLRSEYGRHDYFVLSLSRKGKEAIHELGDQGAYSEVLRVLSFRMDDYVRMHTLNDTLRPIAFQIDRTYGMADATNVLFVFPKTGSESITIHVEEFGLELGANDFTFLRKDLNVPLLSNFSQAK